MRIAPRVTLTEQQRKQLKIYSRGRRVAARLMERSRIVLLAADGKQDSEIAVLLVIPRQKAARWRRRFLDLGVAGLEKDVKVKKDGHVISRTDDLMAADEGWKVSTDGLLLLKIKHDKLAVRIDVAR